ncbi:MAG: biotin--[acetyl-CoA-carboxylase] ligase [Beijerinckiaceae bacterium]
MRDRPTPAPNPFPQGGGEFAPGAGAVAAASGHRVEFLETVGSTNNVALERARAGARAPLWIVGGEQTGGRGRLGRQWHSPPGNLYASLLLTDPCEPHRAPELGFVAGVALADAAREALGRPPGLGLKWPNDLVCDGAKLSGMLLEATRLPGGDFVAVIGIGVNCRSHPEGLAYPTTDLETLRPGAGDPAAFFALLSDALARALAVWARGEGFAAIRDLWLSACLGRGGPIRVALGERVIEGTFDTIDQHGRLVVLTGEGAVAIDAGDVLLGPREAARPQGRT